MPVPVQATRQTVASSSTLATRAAVSAMSVTCPAVSLWRNRVLRPNATGSGEAGTRCVCPVAVLVALARLLHVRLRPSVRSANPPTPARCYTLCTDIQFDAVDNVMIAIFELPGVKKADVRISLATCPFSRAKQLTVSGSSRSALATERGHTVLERKFGDFAKSICIPPETQPHDVRATMEDGVLTLRIPGGQPTQASQPQDVLLV
ncbi:hypothetical protein FOMPIDRAFT_48550 [Fomitopsis schrenkii]|uniref:SHSP domain-containing protein n=1 Tax=Fomitopsis schrenkii TaxID=2126942 RepID=S8F7Y3_FOMSC|nr:hypothetical protein FOMPIDRAFT_48550 [Fomitopsis schrenkii]